MTHLTADDYKVQFKCIVNVQASVTYYNENETKLISKSGESKGVWDLKVHQDGVKMANSPKWRSVVVSMR